MCGVWCVVSYRVETRRVGSARGMGIVDTAGDGMRIQDVGMGDAASEEGVEMESEVEVGKRMGLSKSVGEGVGRSASISPDLKPIPLLQLAAYRRLGGFEPPRRGSVRGVDACLPGALIVLVCLRLCP